MLFRRKDRPPAGPAVAIPSPGGPAEPSLPAGGGTVVGPQTRIRGSIRGQGPVVIQGAVEGEITIRGGLRVAESGRLEASVEARNVELSGQACGSMRAVLRVVLEPTALFEGELSTPVLDARPGSILRGRTRVAGVAEGERRRSH